MLKRIPAVLIGRFFFKITGNNIKTSIKYNITKGYLAYPVTNATPPKRTPKMEAKIMEISDLLA